MNSLTQTNPADRKESFKKLFGLERYSTVYEGLAKKKIDEKNILKIGYQKANEVLHEDVKKMPLLQKEMEKHNIELKNLKTQKKPTYKKS